MVCYPCSRCQKIKPVSHLDRRIQQSTGKLVFVCKSGDPDDGEVYTMPSTIPAPTLGLRVRA